MAVVLVVAFVLGTLIGAERQYRQRTAGPRTNVLVAFGATAFVTNTIVTSEIDAVVARLEQSPLVNPATWTARTAD